VLSPSPHRAARGLPATGSNDRLACKLLCAVTLCQPRTSAFGRLRFAFGADQEDGLKYQDRESKKSERIRSTLAPRMLDALRRRRHSSRTRVSLDRHAMKPWTGMVAKLWTGIT